jgi:UDP-N-acetylglucosamine:LPS N-acetylglucosamine transferase
MATDSAAQGSTSTARDKRVLAISSGGGHWVELRRLRAAWSGCDVAYATAHPGYRAEVEAEPDPGGGRVRFFSFLEANRWQKVRMIGQLAGIIWILIRVRPHVIVSTGSSPGFFAVRLGRMLLGSRTIWIQSIADTEGMSLSGQLAGKHADLWLTQWEHLAKPEGPHYHGSVL